MNMEDFQEADELLKAIRYFHVSNRITIRKQSGPYDDHLRILFAHLPELFDYIEKHNVTALDLSMVTDYGGHAMPASLVAPRLFTKGMVAVVEELRVLLSRNKTLTYCNIGLFADEYTRTEIQTIFEDHPTIDAVSLTSIGAPTYYHMPPNSMYRDKPAGFLYWGHFRRD